MSKLLFNKEELKPKGRERDNKIHVPDKLVKVQQDKKPLITLTFWERLQIWLWDATDYVIEKAFANIVPNWFWCALLVIAIITIIIITY